MSERITGEKLQLSLGEFQKLVSEYRKLFSAYCTVTDSTADVSEEIVPNNKGCNGPHTNPNLESIRFGFLEYVIVKNKVPETTTEVDTSPAPKPFSYFDRIRGGRVTYQPEHALRTDYNPDPDKIRGSANIISAIIQRAARASLILEATPSEYRHQAENHIRETTEWWYKLLIHATRFGFQDNVSLEDFLPGGIYASRNSSSQRIAFGIAATGAATLACAESVNTASVEIASTGPMTYEQCSKIAGPTNCDCNVTTGKDSEGHDITQYSNCYPTGLTNLDKNPGHGNQLTIDKHTTWLNSPIPNGFVGGAGFGKANPAGNQSFHNGIDIFPPSQNKDWPVVAVCGGEVVWARWWPSFTENSGQGHGLTVIIRTEDGLYIGSSHLREGSIAVSVGQRVSQGERLATAGTTGYMDTKEGNTHVHESVSTCTPQEAERHRAAGELGKWERCFLNPADYLGIQGCNN